MAGRTLSPADIAVIIAERRAIYDYIEKKYHSKAEELKTDPAGVFSKLWRPYMLTDTDGKQDIRHGTPETIAEIAKKWSFSAVYAEISEAAADAFTAAEAEKIAAEEERKKAAAFDAIQARNALMIEFLKDLRPIFKSFSGKVFNKKLDDALKAAFPYNDDNTKRCYINRQSYHPGDQYSRVDLHLYTKNNNDYEYLQIAIDDTPGKQPRINYEKTAANIDASIKELEERIAANNAAKANFNDEIRAAEAVKKALEAYTEISNRIPDQFKRIYKLPHDVVISQYNALCERNRR
jgi:hypothetical protein